MIKRRSIFKKSLIIILTATIICSATAQQPAFPTAEGFGKYTTGGRGGTLYIVSNLNDSGPGSFREAVQAKGKRTVIFSVSGIIRLQSGLTISNGDISILGQSAPGDGICIANYTVTLNADNIIIRYMRFRPGSYQTGEYDASWGRNRKNIILDHCSYSWGNDEQASFYDNENFTMQHCIISESFYSSTHPKGNHGFGGIWGGWGATFHHNLIANHTSRTPRFCGARYHLETASNEIVDFRNNVIFNWGYNSAYGGESGNHNMVNNYYKPGPATGTGSVRNRIINPSDTKSAGNPISKWYIAGNYVEGNSTVSSNNWNGGVQPSDATLTLAELRLNSPLAITAVTTHTAQQAYTLVLEKAGASLVRDAADTRVVNAAKSGTVNYGGAYGATSGIIDNETQVGGYPTYNTYNRITDVDKDGMDDTWESLHGMSVGVKDDAGDVDGNGYTNIEDYLNCITGEGSNCEVNKDCNGVVEGSAELDACGVCTGGNTGVEPCTGAMEGEEFCSAIGVLESSNAGYIGAGYVNFENQLGSSGTWNIYSETSKTIEIGIRYANGGTAARGMSVSVNGNIQTNFIAAPTGGWTTWITETVALNVSKGVNTLVLSATTDAGGPNVDLFAMPDETVVAGTCATDCHGDFGGVAFTDECGTCVSGNTGKVACTPDCKGVWGGTATLDNCGVCIGAGDELQACRGSLEAEDACEFVGTIDNNNAGFSGEGFLNTTNAIGASGRWVLNSEINQSATISFRYANGGTSSRDGAISINGVNVGTLLLPPTGGWTVWATVALNLNLVEGSNNVVVSATSADGLANLDLINYSEGVSDALCLITGINRDYSDELSIYPNPTNDKVFISTQTHWILYSAYGNELQRGSGLELDLSDYSEGCYFLKMNSQTIKIIKQ